MITDYSNELNNIHNGIKNQQYVGLAIGLTILAVTVYAFSLSIKVDKLNLRKLKDEGYE